MDDKCRVGVESREGNLRKMWGNVVVADSNEKVDDNPGQYNPIRVRLRLAEFDPEAGRRSRRLRGESEAARRSLSSDHVDQEHLKL